MKKSLCLTLILILIFSCVQQVGAAFEPELTVQFTETVFRDVIDTNDSNVSISSTGEFTESDFSSVYYYNHSVGGVVFSAYSELAEIEKELYDALLISIKNGTLSARIDYTPALSAADFSAIDWKALLESFVVDHPEYYFITSMSRSWGAYSSGDVAYIILKATTKSYYDNTVLNYTEEQIQTCNEELKKVISEIDVDLTTRYNFVKSVHDYLCNNISYVNNQSRCHDAYGALVEKEAVCQGYAEAFKLICDYYKIPCVCVSGTGNGGAHMWNAVQMDDGYWYLIDATWDDQYRIFYDYFLSGSQTVANNFDDLAFSESHIIADEPYIPSLPYAVTGWISADAKSAFGATYNSVVSATENILIRSFFDAESSNIYYNGIYVDASDYATDAKITVPSGPDGTNENWTLVLIGDCNGDSSADASDYSVAVNKVLSDTSVSTVFDMAADAHNDGYLDVIDLAILERAISGLNTDIVLE